MTWDSLQSLLAGHRSVHQPYYAIFSPDLIAPDELRIGLERDQMTHRAVDGMLYSASHRRPRQDIRLLVRYHIEDGSPLTGSRCWPGPAARRPRPDGRGGPGKAARGLR